MGKIVITLDTTLVKLFAAMLRGLVVPATAQYLHLSVAYEPYMEIMRRLEVTSRSSADQIEAAIHEKLITETPAAPPPASVSVSAGDYYYDDEGS